MRKILLMFLIIVVTKNLSAQPQNLTLLVVIDNNICQDIINGKFFIRENGDKLINEMPFRVRVGKLQMTDSDYKKLFTFRKEYGLFVTFDNNNFTLNTDYTYTEKIPKGMINNEYLILNIYNKKNKESAAKYIFPANKEYVLQILSPGYYTKLKVIDK